VGANLGFGGACGHEPAEFLDGERAEEVLGVGKEFRDEPDQGVDIVVDGASAHHAVRPA
jgi:hypothetical protein